MTAMPDPIPTPPAPNPTPEPTPTPMPPISGYLNWQEFAKALLSGFGQGSFAGLALYVVMILGESAHLWYTGPGAAIVVSLLTLVASYLRTKTIARKYLERGE